MPDFFEPDSAFPIDGFPPKSDVDKQALQDFFGGPANPQKTKEKLEAFGKLLKNNGAKRLGVYGFCWGMCMSYILSYGYPDGFRRWKGRRH